MALLERLTFNRVKVAGMKLFSLEQSRSYEVFQERSLIPAFVDHCVQNVCILPALLKTYTNKLQHHFVHQSKCGDKFLTELALLWVRANLPFKTSILICEYHINDSWNLMSKMV